MVPKVSFAGIMNEILAMLRIIPAENMMSETSSGSGAQLGVQSAERQTVNRLICFPNENKEIKALSQLQLLLSHQDYSSRSPGLASAFRGP